MRATLRLTKHELVLLDKVVEQLYQIGSQGVMHIFDLTDFEYRRLIKINVKLNELRREVQRAAEKGID